MLLLPTAEPNSSHQFQFGRSTTGPLGIPQSLALVSTHVGVGRVGQGGPGWAGVGQGGVGWVGMDWDGVGGGGGGMGRSF